MVPGKILTLIISCCNVLVSLNPDGMESMMIRVLIFLREEIALFLYFFLNWSLYSVVSAGGKLSLLSVQLLFSANEKLKISWQVSFVFIKVLNWIRVLPIIIVEYWPFESYHYWHHLLRVTRVIKWICHVEGNHSWKGEYLFHTPALLILKLLLSFLFLTLVLSTSQYH